MNRSTSTVIVTGFPILATAFPPTAYQRSPQDHDRARLRVPMYAATVGSSGSSRKHKCQFAPENCRNQLAPVRAGIKTIAC